jgi:hypothetical protein
MSDREDFVRAVVDRLFNWDFWDFAAANLR